MAELTEDDASSVVFQGGVVQEPRVCSALDELIPVTEVRQACGLPVIHGHDSVVCIAPLVVGAEARVSSDSRHSRT